MVKHQMMIAAVAVAGIGGAVGSALGQTTVATLGTYSGSEGAQWHYEFAPDKRIKRMTFTHIPEGAVQTALIRPIRFLATDSGNATAYEEQTICLDADAWTQSDTLTPGTDGGDDYYAGTPVENHVCQREHTIPAYSEPAVVSCTATNYALDCSSQNPMPDSVSFGVVSVDNDCRSMRGVKVTVTFADDSDAVGQWNITDDDLLPCPG